MWKCSFDSRTWRAPCPRIQSFPPCGSRTPYSLLQIHEPTNFGSRCPIPVTKFRMIDFICSLLLGCKIDTRQTPPCRLLPIIYAISSIIGSISSPSTQRRTSHLNAQNCLAHYRKLTSAPVSMTASRHYKLIVHCIFLWSDRCTCSENSKRRWPPKTVWRYGGKI